MPKLPDTAISVAYITPEDVIDLFQSEVKSGVVAEAILTQEEAKDFLKKNGSKILSKCIKRELL